MLCPLLVQFIVHTHTHTQLYMFYIDYDIGLFYIDYDIGSCFIFNFSVTQVFLLLKKNEIYEDDLLGSWFYNRFLKHKEHLFWCSLKTVFFFFKKMFLCSLMCFLE